MPRIAKPSPAAKPSAPVAARRASKPFLRLTQGGLDLLGILWALPLTLFGLCFAIPILIGGGRIEKPRSRTPALLVYGRVADYLLARHPFGVMSAMAIGHIVVAGNDGLTRQIVTHELAHVRQAALWGPLFPFAYIASSLWAGLRGRDAYWYNGFEIAARKAEKTAEKAVERNGRGRQ